MKKTPQIFQSYEEANDAQITLLSAGIDCQVTRRTQDLWDITGGHHEVYGIEVEDDGFERSQEILGMHIVEDYEPLIRCPACGSVNAKRYSFFDSPSSIFTWMLIFPEIWSMYVMRRDGRRYKCVDCKKLFRIKL